MQQGGRGARAKAGRANGNGSLNAAFAGCALTIKRSSNGAAVFTRVKHPLTTMSGEGALMLAMPHASWRSTASTNSLRGPPTVGGPSSARRAATTTGSANSSARSSAQNEASAGGSTANNGTVAAVSGRAIAAATSGAMSPSRPSRRASRCAELAGPPPPACADVDAPTPPLR